MTRALRVAVIGDFDDTFTPHLATNDPLRHAADALGIELDIGWLATEPLERDLAAVESADALWCAPGSPYHSLLGAVAALRHGREHGVPTLGTCGGCQHIIIEYARNVLGFEDAQHAECVCSRARGPRSAMARRTFTSVPPSYGERAVTAGHCGVSAGRCIRPVRPAGMRSDSCRLLGSN